MKLSSFTLLLIAVSSTCRAQISVEANGAGKSQAHSSSHSTSVTTSSDGKTTVKTTVTVIDGVKKTITETTDQNGVTTRKESPESIPLAVDVPRPWIGLRVGEVSAILRDQLDLSKDEGLTIEMVAKNGPASRAQLRVGDLLLSLGERSLATSEALSKALLEHKVGEKTKVVIMRKAKRITLEVELGEAPKTDHAKVPSALLNGVAKGSVKSVNLNVNGAGIESVLENPDLPENFKESIRAMQKALREFEKKGK